MTDIFVSYSRNNKLFVDRLLIELRQSSYTAWLDQTDIRFNTNWWDEIKSGIEMSDKFLLVMSPDSLSSPVCHLEIEYARNLDKPFVLIYLVDNDYETSKARFGERLYQDDKDGFLLKLYDDRNPMKVFQSNWEILPGINRLHGVGVEVLSSQSKHIDEGKFVTFFPLVRQAIEVDNDHARQYTRFFLRSQEWAKSGEKIGFLRGSELLEAEAWLTAWDQDTQERTASGKQPKQPKPDDAIRKFIEVSRSLEDEETRRDKQRETRIKQFRWASGIISVLMIAAVIVAAVVSVIGKQTADSLSIAGATLTSVPPQLTQVAQQIADGAAVLESLRLAGESNTVLSESKDAELAALLAIRALRTAYSPQADVALTNALDNLSSDAILGNPSEDFESYINDVVFTPDGKEVLVGTNNSFQVWDIGTKSIRLRIEDSFSKVGGQSSSVSVSPDGTKLLSGDNLFANIYDRVTGEQITSIVTSYPAVDGEFSQDGKLVALASPETRLAIVADSATGDILKSYIHADYVSSVAFSPNAQLLLSTSIDGKILLWDLRQETEQPIGTLTGMRSRSALRAIFSPDGKLIAAHANDDRIRLWKVEDLTLVKTLDLYKGTGSLLTYTAAALAFAPDGRTLAVADDSTLVLINVETGTPIAKYQGHQDDITSVAYSSDGNTIVTGSTDGTTRLWKIKGSSNALEFAAYTSQLTGLQVSPNGKLLLTTGSDADEFGESELTAVRLWDIATGKRLFSSPSSGTLIGLFDSIISPDGRIFVVAGANYDLEFYDTTTTQKLHSTKNIVEGESVFYNTAAFSQDGKYLATTEHTSKAMRIWNVQDGTVFKTLTKDFAAVSHLMFVGNDQQLLAGDDDGVITLWDIASGEASFLIEAHDGALRSLTVSPDEQQIVSTGYDGELRIWDFNSQTLIRNITGTRGSSLEAFYTSDGRLKYIEYLNGAARYVDAETQQIQRTLFESGTTMAKVILSADGKTLFSGNTSGKVQVRNADYLDILSLACQLIPRDLSVDERENFNIADLEPICPKGNADSTNRLPATTTPLPTRTIPNGPVLTIAPTLTMPAFFASPTFRPTKQISATTTP